jgi:hypothetical protein
MKRRMFVAALVAGALALMVPVPAAAAGIKLHPSGFGEHSYSAWKGQEGEADFTGNNNQALYFQKMTSTVTFAAGVAVFEGVRGLDTAQLGPLGFDYRTDGHCGAGAPRFNLRVENPPGSGIRNTFFFGCNSGMVPATAQEPPEWERRVTFGALPPGEVVSLAIVYDEGQEFPPRYVFLDNIQVGSHIWSSASDNGGGNIAMTASQAEAILTEPFSVALTQ